MFPENLDIFYQKQASSGVLVNRCSENMPQIYRKTPMSKCNICKAGNFIEITPRHGYFPVNLLYVFGTLFLKLWYGCSTVNLLYIFGTPFLKNTSGRPLLFSSLLGKLPGRKFSSWHAFNNFA